ncbi:MAG: hypothetical protein IKI63_01655, partial [Clostridia bacterium]|nr:hypothetical protein [Clostridia bacterium]
MPPFPAPLTYPPAGVPGQPMPSKKGKTGLLIGIIAAVLVVLGVTAFFGFRDGGFLRGFDPRVPSGWSQTDATTRKTRKTKKTKTSKTTATTEATTAATASTTATTAATASTTATTAKTNATTAKPAAVGINEVAGVYPFTGDYKEYFGETVVEEGTIQGSLEFTVSGSQLVAAFLPKEEGDIS